MHFWQTCQYFSRNARNIYKMMFLFKIFSLQNFPPRTQDAVLTTPAKIFPLKAQTKFKIIKKFQKKLEVFLWKLVYKIPVFA